MGAGLSGQCGKLTEADTPSSNPKMHHVMHGHGQQPSRIARAVPVQVQVRAPVSEQGERHKGDAAASADGVMISSRDSQGSRTTRQAARRSRNHHHHHHHHHQHNLQQQRMPTLRIRRSLSLGEEMEELSKRALSPVNENSDSPRQEQEEQELAERQMQYFSLPSYAYHPEGVRLARAEELQLRVVAASEGQERPCVAWQGEEAKSMADASDACGFVEGQEQKTKATVTNTNTNTNNIDIPITISTTTTEATTTANMSDQQRLELKLQDENALREVLSDGGKSKKTTHAPVTMLASSHSETSFHEQQLKMRRQQRQQLRHRSNSTSTLFINQTMDNPDNDLTIYCVAVVVSDMVRNGIVESKSKEALLVSESKTKTKSRRKSNPKPKSFACFELTKKQLAQIGNSSNHVAPSTHEVYKFMHSLFVKAQLSAECNVIALAYLDRVVAATNIVLTPHNWRHLLFGSLLLASKVWDDLSMINVDFGVVCPLFNIKQINALEVELLRILDFDVAVSGIDYARYYFRLREVCALHKREAYFPLQPLDKKAASRLHLCDENTSESLVNLMPPAMRRKVTCDEETLRTLPRAIMAI